MTFQPQFLKAKTMHARRGGIDNRFTYAIDCVLIDPDCQENMSCLARNCFHIFSINDHDYGPIGSNENPIEWVKEQFAKVGLDTFELRLLTQPRMLGTLFNPVSFWLAYKNGALIAFLAEVNNTFKERHFYLCHHADFRAISGNDKISAKKVFYVSPFQEIAGTYAFTVSLLEDSFSIHIDFQNGEEGVLATMYGTRTPLTFRTTLGALLMRPFAGIRVFVLIFYQAIKLKIKGAKYRTRPKPPKTKVSS